MKLSIETQGHGHLTDLGYMNGWKGIPNLMIECQTVYKHMIKPVQYFRPNESYRTYCCEKCGYKYSVCVN